MEYNETHTILENVIIEWKSIDEIKFYFFIKAKGGFDFDSDNTIEN